MATGGACPTGGTAGIGGLVNCNPGVSPCAQGQFSGAPAIVPDSSQLNIMWSLAPNTILGSRYVLNPGSVITSLGAIIGLTGSAATGTFQMALYSDNNGAPDSLIYSTDDTQGIGSATSCNNDIAVVPPFTGLMQYTVPANVFFFWIMLRVTGTSPVQVVTKNSGSMQHTGCASLSTSNWPATAPSPFTISPACASGSSAVGVVPYLFTITQ